jgi:hypothetical protein
VPRLGQQSPPRRDERGHERLQQPPKGDAAVGLHGDDRAVDGGKRETRELVGRGAVWVDAVRIGHLDGDLYDPRCTWLRHRQIASDGALLVRPDRFIAWRQPAGAGEPRAVLAAVLSQILARPVGALATSAA